MIPLADKTMEEINEIVQRGSVLIFSGGFNGGWGKDSRHYLVTKRNRARRNQRIYSLSLYEIGATHQVVHEYNTSTLFQHRSHYYLIPRGEKK